MPRHRRGRLVAGGSLPGLPGLGSTLVVAALMDATGAVISIELYRIARASREAPEARAAAAKVTAEWAAADERPREVTVQLVSCSDCQGVIVAEVEAMSDEEFDVTVVEYGCTCDQPIYECEWMLEAFAWPDGVLPEVVGTHPRDRKGKRREGRKS